MSVMNQTVGESKKNLANALEKIKGTVEAVNHAEESLRILKNKDIAESELPLYAHHIKIA